MLTGHPLRAGVRNGRPAPVLRLEKGEVDRGAFPCPAQPRRTVAASSESGVLRQAAPPVTRADDPRPPAALSPPTDATPRPCRSTWTTRRRRSRRPASTRGARSRASSAFAASCATSAMTRTAPPRRSHSAATCDVSSPNLGRGAGSHARAADDGPSFRSDSLQGLLLAVRDGQDHGREREPADPVHGRQVQRHRRREDGRAPCRARDARTVRRASACFPPRSWLTRTAQVPLAAEPDLRRRRLAPDVVPGAQLRVRGRLRRPRALARHGHPDRLVQVRQRVLLRLPGGRPPPVLLSDREALAQEVRRRLGDEQLDQRKHQGVHKVPLDDREERRVQRAFASGSCCSTGKADVSRSRQHMTCKKCKWVRRSFPSSADVEGREAHELVARAGVLLGLHGPVVGARDELVQLRAVRGQGRQQEHGRPEQVARLPRAIPPRTLPSTSLFYSAER